MVGRAGGRRGCGRCRHDARAQPRAARAMPRPVETTSASDDACRRIGRVSELSFLALFVPSQNGSRHCCSVFASSTWSSPGARVDQGLSLFRKHCYNARPRAPRSLPTSPVERVARPLPLASRWSPVDRQSWASGRARSAQTRPSPAAATRTAHRGCAPSALSAAPCHCSCANRRHSIAHDGRRLPACRQPTGLVDPCPAEHTVEHREAQGARVDESG